MKRTDVYLLFRYWLQSFAVSKHFMTYLNGNVIKVFCQASVYCLLLTRVLQNVCAQFAKTLSDSIKGAMLLPLYFTHILLICSRRITRYSRDTRGQYISSGSSQNLWSCGHQVVSEHFHNSQNENNMNYDNSDRMKF